MGTVSEWKEKDQGFSPWFYLFIVVSFTVFFPQSAPELLTGKPLIYFLVILLSGTALILLFRKIIPDKTFQTLALAYFLCVLKDFFLSDEIVLGTVLTIPGIAFVWNAKRIIPTFSSFTNSIDERDFEGKALKKFFIPLLFSAVLYQFLLPFGPAGQLKTEILLSEEQFVTEEDGSSRLQIDELIKEIQKDKQVKRNVIEKDN
ncbi:hypothetical protein [Desulfurobacterium crinifex]